MRTCAGVKLNPGIPTTAVELGPVITVSCAVPLMPLTVAVTVALPAARAERSPSLVTVAIALFDDAQVAVAFTTFSDASRAVALNCCDAPTPSVREGGETDTMLTAGPGAASLQLQRNGRR